MFVEVLYKKMSQKSNGMQKLLFKYNAIKCNAIGIRLQENPQYSFFFSAPTFNYNWCVHKQVYYIFVNTFYILIYLNSAFTHVYVLNILSNKINSLLQTTRRA